MMQKYSKIIKATAIVARANYFKVQKIQMNSMKQSIQTSIQFNKQTKYAFSSLPRHDKLQMPALSPTMEKGKIVKWLKNEGDFCGVGETLCEIETDKATVGYELQDEGYLAKKMFQEGISDVNVGEALAIMVSSKSDVDAFRNYSGEQQLSQTQKQQKSTPQKQETSTPQPKQNQAPQKTYPSHTKLQMPALSPTMEKGKIAKWLKKEGEFIGVGEILCEIETDKATVGFEMQDDGYIGKICIPQEGVEVMLGEVLAILCQQKDVSAFKDFNPYEVNAPQQSQQQESVQQQQTLQSQSTRQKTSGDRLFISPLAKMTAEKLALDLNLLQNEGSGPQGRVLKHDVERVSQSAKTREQPAQQQPVEKKPVDNAKKPVNTPPATSGSNPYKDIPVTNIRQVIANRLLQSKTTIPHYYLSKTVDMDDVLNLRVELNKESKVKVSVNDLIIKAASLACRDVPEVNSQWHGSVIRQFTNCDVSVAVSTDNGLITPIVFNANQKGLSEIASDVKSLAEKARNNKLQPNEFIGGTFTISNLGMFGIDNFCAVINPPQSCILAVGKTEKKVVFDASNHEQQYKVVSQMSVTLSCDHRVVDGAVGAQWLQAFAKYIEKPYNMLL